MAVTDTAAEEVRVLPNGFLARAKKVTFGIATLSGGTVELDTGLTKVIAFIATGCQTTATEALVLSCQEDLPYSSGTVTVDGTLVDEGAATKDGGSSTFCWIAIGE